MVETINNYTKFRGEGMSTLRDFSPGLKCTVGFRLKRRTQNVSMLMSIAGKLILYEAGNHVMLVFRCQHLRGAEYQQQVPGMLL